MICMISCLQAIEDIAYRWSVDERPTKLGHVSV